MKTQKFLDIEFRDFHITGIMFVDDKETPLRVFAYSDRTHRKQIGKFRYLVEVFDFINNSFKGGEWKEWKKGA